MSGEDFFSWFRKRKGAFFGDPFRPFFDIEVYFREFDKMMEEAFKEVESKVPKELVRERRLTDGSLVREMGPFVYGYTITIGPDGKPKMSHFGNVKPSLAPHPSVEVSERREPLVDIIDENEHIKVVAEMPGIEKEQVNLSYEEGNLKISAEAGTRSYFKVVELPAEVDPNSGKASVRNGVLELTLKKKGKPKGQKIRIE